MKSMLKLLQLNLRLLFSRSSEHLFTWEKVGNGKLNRLSPNLGPLYLSFWSYTSEIKVHEKFHAIDLKSINASDNVEVKT